MKLHLICFGLVCLLNASCSKKESPSNRIESNEVAIGNQVWMKSNLSVTKYRNGDIIPEVKDWNEWKNLRSGAWCYYNNDPSTNEKYGKLYNFYAVVDSRGLAPEGWHIPIRDEVQSLMMYLGGSLTAGGKMKSTGNLEAGTGLWKSPNTSATNSSGFSANPAGARYASSSDFDFDYMGFSSIFWMFGVTVVGADPAPIFNLGNETGGLGISETSKRVGLSVRCIKD